MTEPLLRFEGVTLRRGGRLLFEDLDLTLVSGEALHVTGANGAGKSSIIRLAAGLLNAEQGAIRREELALADEQLALDRELPLRRALEFWARASRTHQALEESIRKLGLEHLSHIPVGLLSTGQAKRAGLARVLASRARLWLLDEPLNGLDAEGAERLASILEEHRAAGGAVLAASHLALPGEWRRLELAA